MRISLTKPILLGTLLLAAWMPGFAAKPIGPTLSIAMQDLGYQAMPSRYTLGGDSVFTVNFVDEHHLLVTFATRGLLKRLPDGQPDDQDRSVQALLLELPTGEIVGRTTWRLRDHGQYLWPLGHGDFLLRIRNHLSLLEPLAHLPAKTSVSASPEVMAEVFKEREFIDLHRRFGYLTVSPGGDLLTIETTAEPKKSEVAEALAASQLLTPESTETPFSNVQINFFRLLTEPQPGRPDRLVGQAAGVIASHALIEIPSTAEGFLEVKKESAAVFDFDYLTHAGQRKELSPFDTTCSPRPYFISKSEFIAFGCAVNSDKQQLAEFNLRGEESWISVFSNHHLFPYIASAPAAGRFALSRTITTGSYLDVDNLTPDQIASQEVTVYQNWDGRQLLKLQTSPVARAGQNFDLSQDGLQLAAIRNEHLEVYALPALSGKDREAVAAAAKDAPPRSEVTIAMGAESVTAPGRTGATTAHKSEAAAGAAGGEPLGDEPEPAAGPVTSSASAASAEANGPVNGDEVKRRAPPTLYDADHPKPANPQ